MSQEARPWAWIEALTPEAVHEIRGVLAKAHIVTAWGRGGLKVGPGAYPKQVVVVLDDPSAELDREGNSEMLEQAEVALRQAGYGMYLTRRQAADGSWRAPNLRVLGKSAQGVGPQTVRERATVESGAPDLPAEIG
jgi:hypothetical protein